MTPPAAATGRSDGPVRTVVFGSGAFAVPALRALAADPRIRIVAVVTPPDRPAGRRGALTPVPVATEAARLGLPHRPMDRLRVPEAAPAIAAEAPELGVLADFGRIVPPAILDIPRHGILNLHPSLLPRHRGATPIPATILAGDPRAGVTVMRMDAGLDTGPIVAQATWALDGTETTPELEARSADAAAALLLEILDAYLAGERVPVPQEEAGATLTRPLRRADGRLDPAAGAAALERQVRAYRPWPGAWLDTAVGRLAVHRSVVAEAGPADRSGQLVEDGPGLALTTADGRLRLLEVQPAGGRAMPADEFRRGHPAVLGPLPPVQPRPEPAGAIA